MRSWSARIEHVVDRLVPWLVLALVPLILIELFVELPAGLAFVLSVFDWFVLVVIALDLVFKARHAISVRGFVRAHWIEVISLLPVFLVLRVFEELSLLIDVGESVYDVGSEAVSLERESGRVGRAVSGVQRRTSRMHLFARIARPLARLPRLAVAARFFSHPSERELR